jgi:Na+/melibiose symporter-like transporter
MNILAIIYSAILFFVLTPAVAVRLPPNGSKFLVAAVHAAIFAIIFHFTYKTVWRLTEGLVTSKPSSTPTPSKTPTA